MARAAWHRLDNVGKFYSAQAGSPNQTVFRYSATLADEVDEAALQRALEQAVELFPGFNVCLRSGMFWHYLEQSDEPPAVMRESLPICYGLHVHAKSPLLRASWHRDRVNLEVSHMVSDGRGTLSLFKALLSFYAKERYGVEGLAADYEGTDRQKAENSFDAHFERDKAGRSPSLAAYRLPGRRDPGDPVYLEYHLSASRVHKLARSCGVSLTSLVIAAAVCAIRDRMTPRERERGRAIRLDVPVDLRDLFGSLSVKNFFGLAFVSYAPKSEDEPVERVAQRIQEQLRAETQPDRLKARMNRMVALEKNPLLRLSPLFMKDLVLAAADRLTAREVTTTVSSLGRIQLDERVAAHVRNINVFTSTTGLNFVACTFGDDLSIGISSAYRDLGVVRDFCRLFSARGIEGLMHTSGAREEASAR